MPPELEASFRKEMAAERNKIHRRPAIFAPAQPGSAAQAYREAVAIALPIKKRWIDEWIDYDEEGFGDPKRWSQVPPRFRKKPTAPWSPA